MTLEELEKKYKQVCRLKDGNYNVSTKTREEVTPVEYTAHTNIDEVYGKEGEWGLVDQEGNMIIEPKYTYPFIECGDYYQVMLPEEYKLIEGREKVLTLKHGIIDKKGNIVIPIKYLYLEAMDNSGEYFRVVDKETYKSGVLDKNNKVVIPFQYDFIQATPDIGLRIRNEKYDEYPWHINQVKVDKNDLYGIYDLRLKKEIIKPKYKLIEIISYNRFLVGEDYESLNTIIDENENIIRDFTS